MKLFSKLKQVFHEWSVRTFTGYDLAEQRQLAQRRRETDTRQKILSVNAAGELVARDFVGRSLAERFPSARIGRREDGFLNIGGVADLMPGDVQVKFRSFGGPGGESEHPWAWIQVRVGTGDDDRLKINGFHEAFKVLGFGEYIDAGYTDMVPGGYFDQYALVETGGMSAYDMQLMAKSFQIVVCLDKLLENLNVTRADYGQAVQAGRAEKAVELGIPFPDVQLSRAPTRDLRPDS